MKFSIHIIALAFSVAMTNLIMAPLLASTSQIISKKSLSKQNLTDLAYSLRLQVADWSLPTEN